MSGLVVAVSYEEGKAIVESRDFVRHGSFFQAMFEVTFLVRFAPCEANSHLADLEHDLEQWWRLYSN